MIIREKISREKFKEIIGGAEMDSTSSPRMAKLAADIERKILATGCEFHVFCAEELLENGSERKNVWGANVYPDGALDFTAVFNIRPQDNNRSMEIQNEKTRQEVEAVIKKLLPIPIVIAREPRSRTSSLRGKQGDRGNLAI